MTHTPPAPGRKASKTGLLAPLLVLALLIAAWSGGWLWLKGEAARRLDDAAASFRVGGGRIAWAARRIGGYPFRLDVDFDDLRLTDPSGWGFSAASLKTEAYVFAPTHWIAAAPSGVTVAWPGGGPVTVTGQALRASVSGLNDHPPRLSIEGLGLSFASPAGAKPFFLTAAQDFELHTRAGPNDQGELAVSLDKATARPDTALGQAADGGPVNLDGDFLLSRASAFAGRDWRSAVRAWSQGGGAFTLRRLSVQAGEAALDANAGSLTLDQNGDLSGALAASLHETSAAPNRPSVAAAAPQATLSFRDGVIFLEGAEIGAFPRLF